MTPFETPDERASVVEVSRSREDARGCESVRASTPIRASGLTLRAAHRPASPHFTPTTQVSPASTLHNWKDEVSQFLPHFRLLPYWGGLNDRKQLRRFLDNRQLYCANASFHVVVTSYQLLVSDEKYFKPIKWQYMILDEAQVLSRFLESPFFTLALSFSRHPWLTRLLPFQLLRKGEADDAGRMLGGGGGPDRR